MSLQISDVSGTKKKRWYQSNVDNQLVLFKIPISYTSETQTIGEPTGETWSEKIYSEIRGSLCWSFLKEKESLVEGSDIIMDYDQTYDRNFLQGETEFYNFDLLFRIFSDYSIIDDLFRMIIFDTLIGNTDRHQDNFGIIRSENTGDITGFAPLYDNASSLGRELTIKRVEKMLKDRRMFHAYLFGNKSTTLIRWGLEWKRKGLNIFEFYNLVKEQYPYYIEKNLKAVEALTNKVISNIIHKVPTIVMSDVHKEIVFKILTARRDYLLS